MSSLYFLTNSKSDIEWKCEQWYELLVGIEEYLIIEQADTEVQKQV